MSVLQLGALKYVLMACGGKKFLDPHFTSDQHKNFFRDLPYALVAQCEKFGEIRFGRIRVIALQTQEMRNFLIHKEVGNF